MHQWQGQRHGHHLPMHRTETIWSATVECQVSPFKATDSCYILTNISPEGLVRVANLFFPVPATYWAVIGFLYIRFYGYTTSDDHICIKSKFMLRKRYTHILERTGRCNRWLITQHEVTGVRSNTIVAVPYSDLGLDSKSGSNPAMSRIGGSSPIRGWVWFDLQTKSRLDFNENSKYQSRTQMGRNRRWTTTGENVQISADSSRRTPCFQPITRQERV